MKDPYYNRARDPHECPVGPDDMRPEPGDTDEFDRFLRLTGGDAAPRGGHAEVAKAHAAKVKTPYPEKYEKDYPIGGSNVLAPVSQRLPEGPMGTFEYTPPKPKSITTAKK